MKLKIKKISVLFVILIACMFSFYSAYSEYVCVVSSNQDLNTGACMTSEVGNGDICWPMGFGPACAYSAELKKAD